jgi:hypothetical protein
MFWLGTLVWCLVAIGLLVFNRRFWTQPPAEVDDRDRSVAAHRSGSEI